MTRVEEEPRWTLCYAACEAGFGWVWFPKSPKTTRSSSTPAMQISQDISRKFVGDLLLQHAAAQFCWGVAAPRIEGLGGRTAERFGGEWIPLVAEQLVTVSDRAPYHTDWCMLGVCFECNQMGLWEPTYKWGVHHLWSAGRLALRLSPFRYSMQFQHMTVRDQFNWPLLFQRGSSLWSGFSIFELRSF